MNHTIVSNFRLLSRASLFSVFSAALLAGAATTVRADELCRPCPFDCAGIGLKSKDCSYRQSRVPGECCVDLNGRGMDRLREVDQINQRNAQYGNQYGNPYGNQYGGSHGDRPGEVQGDCPPGYHINDRNCTDDERRRGCSDLRSPSNQRCVGWKRR